MPAIGCSLLGDPRVALSWCANELRRSISKTRKTAKPATPVTQIRRWRAPRCCARCTDSRTTIAPQAHQLPRAREMIPQSRVVFHLPVPITTPRSGGRELRNNAGQIGGAQQERVDAYYVIGPKPAWMSKVDNLALVA